MSGAPLSTDGGASAVYWLCSNFRHGRSCFCVTSRRRDDQGGLSEDVPVLGGLLSLGRRDFVDSAF